MSRDRKGHGLRVVDLKELQWLPRHVRGDDDAFPALMEAYRAPVWNYLARCGVSLSLREDLFQDIFLKIHQSAASYRAAWPLRPWVFTIAANTLRNHVRDRQRYRQNVGCKIEYTFDARDGFDQRKQALNLGAVTVDEIEAQELKATDTAAEYRPEQVRELLGEVAALDAID